MKDIGKEEAKDKSECPAVMLGLCGLTTLCQPSTRTGNRRDQCATWGIHQNTGSVWSVAGPAGLSSKEFFGLHRQIPVQFYHGVIGHLADLLLYESDGIL